MMAQHWDLILIALTLVALVAKRTRLTIAAMGLSVPAALIASSEIISLPARAALIGGIYLLITWLAHTEYRKTASEAGRYVQWLALCCSSISFIKLFVWGVVVDIGIHNKIHEGLDGVMLWITTLIACCLFLRDKPVGLHELVRDILNGTPWLRNLSGLLRDDQRKV